jgi:hypothetical protein
MKESIIDVHLIVHGRMTVEARQSTKAPSWKCAINTYSTCIWNLYFEILQFDIEQAKLKSYPYATKCASLMNNFNGV